MPLYLQKIKRIKNIPEVLLIYTLAVHIINTEQDLSVIPAGEFGGYSKRQHIAQVQKTAGRWGNARFGVISCCQLKVIWGQDITRCSIAKINELPIYSDGF